MMLLFSSLLYVMSFTTVASPENKLDSLKKQEYEHYMQKSKNQATAATILVAAGAAGGFFTLLYALLTAFGNGLVYVVSLGTYEPKRRSYTAPLLLTGAVIATGFILFAAASRNKKIAKGLSVSAGVGNTSLLQQQRYRSYAYPTLSFKISF